MAAEFVGVGRLLRFLFVYAAFLREGGSETFPRTAVGVSHVRAVGVAAFVLTLGLGILYLPGMPAALVWPCEQLILGGWWLAGIVLVLRLPKIPAGENAEEELVAARSGRRRL